MKPCRLRLLPEAEASCAAAQLFHLSPFAVKPVTASHAFRFVTGIMRFPLFRCL